MILDIFLLKPREDSLVNREHLVLYNIVVQVLYRCSLFTNCAYVVVEEANNFLCTTLWYRYCIGVPYSPVVLMW